MFCPKLQILLKPLYNLTRKARNFIWEKEQQEVFEETKRRTQCYICPMTKEGFTYIWMQVNFWLVVRSIRFKMENQD